MGDRRGIADMALSAFWFSAMTLLVKLVGQRIPNQEVVLVRGVFTLLFSWLLLRRVGVPMLGRRRIALVIRGLLGFGALTCLYFAVTRLPLAEATVLQYTNPLWAALLGTIYLGERLRGREIVFVLGSLAGVVAIARPSLIFGGAASGLDSVAVAAGLAGAVFSGAAYVGVRQLSRTEHPLVIVFYFPLVTIPAALPGALLNPVLPTAREWALLAGIGVTAQLGQVYITRGLKHVPVGRATAVGYLQVVFAAIWGLIFFAESPDLWTVAGAMIILGCTVGIALTGTARRVPVADPAPPPVNTDRFDGV